MICSWKTRHKRTSGFEPPISGAKNTSACFSGRKCGKNAVAGQAAKGGGFNYSIYQFLIIYFHAVFEQSTGLHSKRMARFILKAGCQTTGLQSGLLLRGPFGPWLQLVWNSSRYCSSVVEKY